MKTNATQKSSLPEWEYYPLTPDRWKDLEFLFGEKGACGGCWCMWWRLSRSEFIRQKGDKNKSSMKKIVKSGEIPGILGYVDGKPVAWCSIGPRDVFPALERSRVLKRVDDQPVWSVVCFFIAKPFRKKSMSVKILQSAVDYAKRNGVKIVEGYPVEPKKGKWPDVFAWTGFVSAFKKAGFKEVHRGSPTRPIMRYSIEK